MPSAAAQNPPVQAPKKKKGPAAQLRNESPAPSATSATDRAASNAGDGEESKNPHVLELQKNIRNINKKIANASKTDALIDQHKDKSLDELVEAKIINNDQKAQRLKKPQLESQLAGLEDQLAQYLKLDEEYRTRGSADLANLEKSLTAKHDQEKADAIAQLKEQHASDATKTQRTGLLLLSQFLRLAAARRSEDADPTQDENMALEGVLLNVYSGDDTAVSTMLKLIEGSGDKTQSVNGDELQTTFAQVKEAALAQAKLYAADAAPEVSDVPVESTQHVETDPTVAHAGLTEIDATGAVQSISTQADNKSGVPANAGVTDDAANAAAESQWDANNDLSTSQDEWVQVPRDPAETETGLTATPAAASNVQSWADDQPEAVAETATPADSGDGFHQVQRNRPRGNDRDNRGRGGGRGRGGRGGRGGFGEGRGRGGRGRGGPGGPGGPRGGRRNEES
ncbi:uncharacterized protein B0I36DRAFT_8847 [Microdochium trichocladiopsis]|uniref:YAG7-like dimerisation domain-containing protein n=1 Tax=Microdochium trichocladiopsis TaxID=1682393 RepID=A0A9P9BW80_9PEZI|nr:uncharacterized protein B0I36DRAFT_8847 [Microdochium trichocladiopsis]KAH7040335.1 hypothetical protein B0I36DRAFT_8847 [Microdochium trichocladiopsis]